MQPHRKKRNNLQRSSFKKLCELVMDYAYSYEDLAELIEDKGYEECHQGKDGQVIEGLSKLSRFFEEMENKNDENIRDLSDVYLLAGEFLQSVEKYKQSIIWFEKAIIADNFYDAPYHSLAFSHMQLDQIDKAAKCLEEEINIAPGNYYSYLLLVDVYEKLQRFDDIEDVLKNLLSRDASNIQGLHKLICFYEKRKPELDVEFLRRRLLGADKALVKLELIIWTYHMCKEGKYDEAIRFLNEREIESVKISITHLLKAYIFGILRQYSMKKRELRDFRRLNHGREEFMRTKLMEFSKVFGKKAGTSLERKLLLSKLSPND